jgi:opacity protein-like surface antigen
LGVLFVFAFLTSAEARIRRGGGYQNPEGKFAFTTQVGAFVPTGAFGDLAETGIRWTGALDYYPSPDASIGLDFGFGEADAAESNFRWEEQRRAPAQVHSFNYRSYRLGITGRYNIPTHTGISPYLEAGTGIYWTQRRVSGTAVQGGTLFEFSERRTHTTAGGLVGFGINAALGRRTNLYTGFQFHQLFGNDLDRIDNFASLNFGLGIGLWP